MFQRTHTSKVRLYQYKNLRVFCFYVHSYSGVTFFYILSKLKISFFPFIIGRFSKGMDQNPVLMELEKKKRHYDEDLYNFIPTKGVLP